uniref:Putative juvenile hormone-inducible protein n=1 Tax=Corethrella appendiculata TaxID=1370023 RepID=U5ET49_9DIPT
MSLSEISEKFTEENLNEIIRKIGGEKFTKWEFAPGFKKGDSYLSEVYRVIVEGENKNGDKIKTSVVVKSIPKNAGWRTTFRSADFFYNEIIFYNEILRGFYEFQSKRNPVNPFCEIVPALSSFTNGLHDFVAMDDLGQYGYKPANRQLGVDFTKCSWCMKVLARFHALSMAMKDQEPEKFQEIIKNIKETYYAAAFKKWYAKFCAQMIGVAKDAIDKEYGGTEIQLKSKKFLDNNLYDTMVSLVETKNRNSVITHGDCWLPNFLFKFAPNSNEQEPISIKMIDYQLVRYGSPVLDISFFIYSCTNQAMREQYYDELLNIYYTNLTDLIRDLGSDPNKVFPREEFEKELKQFSRFGCGFSIESVPLSIMDDDDTADFSKIESDSAIDISTVWIVPPIPTKEGRLRVADVFKHAVQYGYLD